MNRIKNIYSQNRELYRLLLIMAVWLIFMAITQSKKFYTGANFLTIAGQFPEYGLMALGCMLCMITGGIDLSTVGVANLTSILSVFIMVRIFGEQGVMPTGFIVILFIIAGVTGAIAGAVNAFLISKINVPPILATLGVNELLTGICIVLTGGSAVSTFPKQFSEYFSLNTFGWIPRRLIIFILAAILIWILLEKTTYGTKLRLFGTSSHVAMFSGIHTKALLFKTYIISAILSAFGGLMMLATYSSARADYGTNYTMQAILIVVLGGVSPNGGKGKISGVIAGIILLKLIESGINRFKSVSTYYVTLIWGAVLILALVIDYMSARPKKVKA
ncbi:MAG: ABC transporter permease [Lachnospiraceae bacterium]